MGKKVKTGKERLDKYYHLAKEQGYRARSAFKLIQLVQKHDIFSRCRTLLDLCAAPGGWLQVAQKNMPVLSTIVGVDLAPIQPIRGVTTIQADITTQKCRSLLKKLIPSDLCDVVLHDGAPNVGTSWIHDAYGQNELVLYATKLCCEFLKPGGHYITKIFRSQDYTSILWVLQQLFSRVISTKPSSSRNVSAEIFIICFDYKSPKKIDPKFFDPRHVFLNVGNNITGLSSDRPKKALKELVKDLSRKHRQGYNEEDVYRERCVSEFLKTDIIPTEFIVSCHKIIFTPENPIAMKAYNDSTTTEDIKIFFNDLRVLGKNEYTKLLKWRIKLKKNWDTEEKNLIKKEKLNNNDIEDIDTDDTDNNKNEEDEQEETWNQELTELVKENEKEILKEKKKLNKKLQKLEDIKQRSMGVFDSIDIDKELFQLEDAKKAFNNVQEFEENDIIEGYNSEEENNNKKNNFDKQIIDNSEDEDNSENDDNSSNKTLSDTENDLKYNDPLTYKKLLLQKKKDRNIKKTRRQQAYAEWAKELSQFTEKSIDLNEKIKSKKVIDDISSDDDDSKIPEAEQFRIEEEEEEEEEDEDEKDKTKINNNEEIYISKIQRDRWLDQPIFQEAGMTIDELKEFEKNADEKDDIPELPKSEKQKLREKRKREAKKIEEKKENENRKKNKINPLGVMIDDKDNSKSFEIVPKEYPVVNTIAIESEDDSDKETNLDKTIQIPPKEEIVQYQALSTLLINKRSRMDLLDGAYNRYAFNDDESVPAWFLQEEEIYAKPELPLSKELMREYKKKLQELQRRPIRKSAEAVARKKARLKKRLEKVRKQAESIANSTEHTENSKTQTINRLTQEKRQKTYVTNKRLSGGSVRTKVNGDKTGKVKVVDKRLKKDKRAIKIAMRKKSKFRK